MGANGTFSSLVCDFWRLGESESPRHLLACYVSDGPHGDVVLVDVHLHRNVRFRHLPHLLGFDVAESLFDGFVNDLETGMAVEGLADTSALLTASTVFAFGLFLLRRATRMPGFSFHSYVYAFSVLAVSAWVFLLFL